MTPGAETMDDDTSRDRLYEEALHAYAEHCGTSADRMPQPDRRLSRILSGMDPTVVLMDARGIPLGTVIWTHDVGATFEPPTRITVVDHFQGRRTPEA